MLRDSPQVINFTLTGDEWAAAIGVEPTATGAWLRTLRAEPSSGLLGWNGMVAPTLTASSLSRATPSKLTLRIERLRHFDVGLVEIVPVAAPWWATASNLTARHAWSNFSVLPTTPRVVRLGGTLLAGGAISESDLRSRSYTLEVCAPAAAGPAPGLARAAACAALRVRAPWTSGYETYSPPVDLVAHDYGRKSGSPKFWETVHLGASRRNLGDLGASRGIAQVLGDGAPRRTSAHLGASRRISAGART
jgi:hypothetical protein